MSHHSREWTFNIQSVIYTVREGIFCQVEYFQRDMFTFEAHHKVF